MLAPADPRYNGLLDPVKPAVVAEDTICRPFRLMSPLFPLGVVPVFLFIDQINGVLIVTHHGVVTRLVLQSPASQ